MGAKKKLIVAIFPPPDNPFFKVEADTVVSKAKSLGYETLLLIHNEDPVKEAQLYDTAISQYPARKPHSGRPKPREGDVILNRMIDLLECINTIITLFTIFIVFGPLVGDDGQERDKVSV